MAFTRFHDDPSRITKQLAESTFLGRYQLDTPGQGLDLPFAEDPQMRLQKWGANLRTNTINLENDLRGQTRKLNRDYIHKNNYIHYAATTAPIAMKNVDPFVEESRASHPAWVYRDLEQTRWEHPFLNPQANLEKTFHDNIQTRLLEKDFFRPIIPDVTYAGRSTGSTYVSSTEIPKNY